MFLNRGGDPARRPPVPRPARPNAGGSNAASFCRPIGPPPMWAVSPSARPEVPSPAAPLYPPPAGTAPVRGRARGFYSPAVGGLPLAGPPPMFDGRSRGVRGRRSAAPLFPPPAGTAPVRHRSHRIGSTAGGAAANPDGPPLMFDARGSQRRGSVAPRPWEQSGGYTLGEGRAFVPPSTGSSDDLLATPSPEGSPSDSAALRVNAHSPDDTAAAAASTASTASSSLPDRRSEVPGFWEKARAKFQVHSDSSAAIRKEMQAAEDVQMQEWRNLQTEGGALSSRLQDAKEQHDATTAASVVALMKDFEETQQKQFREWESSNYGLRKQLEEQLEQGDKMQAIMDDDDGGSISSAPPSEVPPSRSPADIIEGMRAVEVQQRDEWDNLRAQSEELSVQLERSMQKNDENDKRESQRVQRAMKALDQAQRSAYSRWEKENEELRTKLESAENARDHASQSSPPVVSGSSSNFRRFFFGGGKSSSRKPAPSSTSVIEEMRAAEESQQTEWRVMAEESKAMAATLEHAKVSLDATTADDVKEGIAILEIEQQSQYEAWEARNSELRSKLEDAQANESEKDTEIERLQDRLAASERRELEAQLETAEKNHDQELVKDLESKQSALWKKLFGSRKAPEKFNDVPQKQPHSSSSSSFSSSPSSSSPSPPSSSPSLSSITVIAEMRAAEEAQQAEWRAMVEKNKSMEDSLALAKANLDSTTANEIKVTMALLEQQQQGQCKVRENKNAELREKLAAAQSHESDRDAEIKELRSRLAVAEGNPSAEEAIIAADAEHRLERDDLREKGAELHDQLEASRSEKEAEEVRQAMKALEASHQSAHAEWQREHDVLRRELERQQQPLAAAAPTTKLSGSRLARFFGAKKPPTDEVIEEMKEVEEMQQEEWRKMAEKGKAMEAQLAQVQAQQDSSTAGEVNATIALLEQQQLGLNKMWENQNGELREKLEAAERKESELLRQLEDQQMSIPEEHEAIEEMRVASLNQKYEGEHLERQTNQLRQQLERAARISDEKESKRVRLAMQELEEAQQSAFVRWEEENEGLRIQLEEAQGLRQPGHNSPQKLQQQQLQEQQELSLRKSSSSWTSLFRRSSKNERLQKRESSVEVIAEIRASEQDQENEGRTMAERSAAMAEQLKQAQAQFDVVTANEVKAAIRALELDQQARYGAWESQKTALLQKFDAAQASEKSKDAEISELKQTHELELGELKQQLAVAATPQEVAEEVRVAEVTQKDKRAYLQSEIGRLQNQLDSAQKSSNEKESALNRRAMKALEETQQDVLSKWTKEDDVLRKKLEDSKKVDIRKSPPSSASSVAGRLGKFFDIAVKSKAKLLPSLDIAGEMSALELEQQEERDVIDARRRVLEAKLKLAFGANDASAASAVQQAMRLLEQAQQGQRKMDEAQANGLKSKLEQSQAHEAEVATEFAKLEQLHEREIELLRARLETAEDLLTSPSAHAVIEEMRVADLTQKYEGEHLQRMRDGLLRQHEAATKSGSAEALAKKAMAFQALEEATLGAYKKWEEENDELSRKLAIAHEKEKGVAPMIEDTEPPKQIEEKETREIENENEDEEMEKEEENEEEDEEEEEKEKEKGQSSMEVIEAMRAADVKQQTEWGAMAEKNAAMAQKLAQSRQDQDTATSRDLKAAVRAIEKAQQLQFKQWECENSRLRSKLEVAQSLEKAKDAEVAAGNRDEVQDLNQALEHAREEQAQAKAVLESNVELLEAREGSWGGKWQTIQDRSVKLQDALDIAMQDADKETTARMVGEMGELEVVREKTLSDWTTETNGLREAIEAQSKADAVKLVTIGLLKAKIEEKRAPATPSNWRGLVSLLWKGRGEGARAAPRQSSVEVVAEMRAAEQAQQAEWRAMADKSKAIGSELDEAQARQDDTAAANVEATKAALEAEQKEKYQLWENQNAELRKRLDAAEAQQDGEISNLKREFENDLKKATEDSRGWKDEKAALQDKLEDANASEAAKDGEMDTLKRDHEELEGARAAEIEDLKRSLNTVRADQKGAKAELKYKEQQLKLSEDANSEKWQELQSESARLQSALDESKRNTDAETSALVVKQMGELQAAQSNLWNSWTAETAKLKSAIEEQKRMDATKGTSIAALESKIEEKKAKFWPLLGRLFGSSKPTLVSLPQRSNAVARDSKDEGANELAVTEQQQSEPRAQFDPRRIGILFDSSSSPALPQRLESQQKEQAEVQGHANGLEVSLPSQSSAAIIEEMRAVEQRQQAEGRKLAEQNAAVLDQLEQVNQQRKPAKVRELEHSAGVFQRQRIRKAAAWQSANDALREKLDAAKSKERMDLQNIELRCVEDPPTSVCKHDAGTSLDDPAKSTHHAEVAERENVISETQQKRLQSSAGNIEETRAAEKRQQDEWHATSTFTGAIVNPEQAKQAEIIEEKRASEQRQQAESLILASHEVSIAEILAKIETGDDLFATTGTEDKQAMVALESQMRRDSFSWRENDAMLQQKLGEAKGSELGHLQTARRLGETNVEIEKLREALAKTQLGLFCEKAELREKNGELFTLGQRNSETWKQLKRETSKLQNVLGEAARNADRKAGATISREITALDEAQKTVAASWENETNALKASIEVHLEQEVLKDQNVAILLSKIAALKDPDNMNIDGTLQQAHYADPNIRHSDYQQGSSLAIVEEIRAAEERQQAEWRALVALNATTSEQLEQARSPSSAASARQSIAEVEEEQMRKSVAWQNENAALLKKLEAAKVAETNHLPEKDAELAHAAEIDEMKQQIVSLQQQRSRAETAFNVEAALEADKNIKQAEAMIAVKEKENENEMRSKSVNWQDEITASHQLGEKNAELAHEAEIDEMKKQIASLQQQRSRAEAAFNVEAALEADGNIKFLKDGIAAKEEKKSKSIPSPTDIVVEKIHDVVRCHQAERNAMADENATLSLLVEQARSPAAASEARQKIAELDRQKTDKSLGWMREKATLLAQLDGATKAQTAQVKIAYTLGANDSASSIPELQRALAQSQQQRVLSESGLAGADILPSPHSSPPQSAAAKQGRLVNFLSKLSRLEAEPSPEPSSDDIIEQMYAAEYSQNEELKRMKATRKGVQERSAQDWPPDEGERTMSSLEIEQKETFQIWQEQNEALKTALQGAKAREDSAKVSLQQLQVQRGEEQLELGEAVERLEAAERTKTEKSREVESKLAALQSTLDEAGKNADAEASALVARQMSALEREQQDVFDTLHAESAELKAKIELHRQNEAVNRKHIEQLELNAESRGRKEGGADDMSKKVLQLAQLLGDKHGVEAELESTIAQLQDAETDYEQQTTALKEGRLEVEQTAEITALKVKVELHRNMDAVKSDHIKRLQKAMSEKLARLRRDSGLPSPSTANMIANIFAPAVETTTNNNDGELVNDDDGDDDDDDNQGDDISEALAVHENAWGEHARHLTNLEEKLAAIELRQQTTRERLAKDYQDLHKLLEEARRAKDEEVSAQVVAEMGVLEANQQDLIRSWEEEVGLLRVQLQAQSEALEMQEELIERHTWKGAREKGKLVQATEKTKETVETPQKKESEGTDEIVEDEVPSGRKRSWKTRWNKFKGVVFRTKQGEREVEGEGGGEGEGEGKGEGEGEEKEEAGGREGEGNEEKIDVRRVENLTKKLAALKQQQAEQLSAHNKESSMLVNEIEDHKAYRLEAKESKSPERPRERQHRRDRARVAVGRLRALEDHHMMLREEMKAKIGSLQDEVERARLGRPSGNDKRWDDVDEVEGVDENYNSDDKNGRLQKSLLEDVHVASPYEFDPYEHEGGGVTQGLGVTEEEGGFKQEWYASNAEGHGSPPATKSAEAKAPRGRRSPPAESVEAEKESANKNAPRGRSRPRTPASPKQSSTQTNELSEEQLRVTFANEGGQNADEAKVEKDDDAKLALLKRQRNRRELALVMAPLVSCSEAGRALEMGLSAELVRLLTPKGRHWNATTATVVDLIAVNAEVGASRRIPDPPGKVKAVQALDSVLSGEKQKSLGGGRKEREGKRTKSPGRERDGTLRTPTKWSNAQPTAEDRRERRTRSLSPKKLSSRQPTASHARKNLLLNRSVSPSSRLRDHSHPSATPSPERSASGGIPSLDLPRQDGYSGPVRRDYARPWDQSSPGSSSGEQRFRSPPSLKKGAPKASGARNGASTSSELLTRSLPARVRPRNLFTRTPLAKSPRPSPLSPGESTAHLRPFVFSDYTNYPVRRHRNDEHEEIDIVPKRFLFGMEPKEQVSSSSFEATPGKEGSRRVESATAASPGEAESWRDTIAKWNEEGFSFGREEEEEEEEEEEGKGREEGRKEKTVQYK